MPTLPAERRRRGSDPAVWLCLAGVVLVTVAVMGLLNLVDEPDIMRREGGMLGMAAVLVCGTAAGLLALLVRSMKWLWASVGATLLGMTALAFPLLYWLGKDYSPAYWKVMPFDAAVGNGPGWWEWFVGRTLVSESLVGITVASFMMIVALVVLIASRRHPVGPPKPLETSGAAGRGVDYR
jgi:hypothetical protein